MTGDVQGRESAVFKTSIPPVEIKMTSFIKKMFRKSKPTPPAAYIPQPTDPQPVPETGSVKKESPVEEKKKVKVAVFGSDVCVSPKKAEESKVRVALPLGVSSSSGQIAKTKQSPKAQSKVTVAPPPTVFVPPTSIKTVDQPNKICIKMPIELSVGKIQKDVASESISKSVRIEEPIRSEVKRTASAEDTSFQIASSAGFSCPIAYDDLIVGRQLGKGAQGVVSSAIHRKSGTEFALKITKFGANFTMKDFKGEVEKLQRIATSSDLDSCAVRMYEVFHLASTHKAAFLMECMPHGSLTDCLLKLAGTSYGSCLPSLPPPPTAPISSGDVITPPPSATRFSMKDVSFIARQGLSALAALQRLRFVHCDIKPHNLLVSGGTVKLADFGVAKGTDTLSVAGTGTGSIGYMPPERIRGETYSYNSDVYSMGMTLGYCALGCYPLKGECEFDALAAVSMGTARVLYPAECVDPELQQFTDLCMSADRTVRPCAEQLLQCDFITKYLDEGPSFIGYLKSPSG